VQQLQLFVSDAAHEIRTPLAILRGETQLLLAQPRGVLEYQQTLTALDGELATMGRIVEGLFTLSMADSGQLKIVGDKVYLHEILDEACGIVAPLAREKQITIETSDWKEQPLVGDQTMLRQLFLILIENAIKYSAPQTTIQVNLDIVQDQPTVTIQDQGMGIAPDDLPHVFKRFYRAAPQTSGESRSGGLGLAIAEAIITAHHGTICCQSTVGVGSIFTVSFTAADL
jgi:signal transduction histidine kinase